ncbi:DUF924 family protein [Aliikangiella sp. G2MR2-5]|uniref:DUF924 family protein n=1 Tax=Aliikangiella sp. G2MR2-5 TaxID=2788943 RepID=UPI0018A9A785|nr:DUF924 family protein [Aliikangiella sp. G2MR2-5]
MEYSDVIQFWFEDSTPADWFKKDESFDQLIRKRFLKTYYAATCCELFDWRKTPEGRLAEVIVLDQFSRNMFRDSAQAFAFDSLAVALCQEAIMQQADLALPLSKRKFLYMPLMHSESLVIHQEAMRVFSQEGLEENYVYEIKHKEIIERFGRYPHRNQILGRESSEEEIAFLNQPGSSF